MDTLTKEARSARMRLVRSKGARSTEWKVRAAFVARGIRGWKVNDASVPGTPDFVFHSKKLALFIDGCFWHSCAKCKRPLPRTNARYWKTKIQRNLARARLVGKQLKARGFRVQRLWEHDLRAPSWHREVLKNL